MKQEKESKKVIDITAILIQDTLSKGYTAYFAEFPEAIAQGETVEEAKLNLLDAFQSIMEFRNEEAKNDSEGDDFITESFELALS